MTGMESLLKLIWPDYFLEQTIAGVEIWQWFGLFLVVLAGLLISSILAIITATFLKKFIINNTDESELVNQFNITYFRKPFNLVFIGWVLLLGFSLLELPEAALQIGVVAAKVVTYVGIIWGGWRIAELIQSILVSKAEKTDTKFDDLLAPLMGRSIKVLVFILGGISIAEILELPLASLLTGLGIGGLAIAMAAKDTIANIFGSLTILIDRPFHIGDWVVLGNHEGSIEKLGFRSTRIRTFYNSEVTVPNSQLLTATVDNMGARKYRRIKTVFGLTYDTSAEKVEAFCEGVRDLLKNNPKIWSEKQYVFFNNYGASALEVLLYCFLDVADWDEELLERHKLFIDIKKCAKDIGVEFAFPTQTVYVKNEKD